MVSYILNSYYDKLLSSLGYEVLNVVYGINHQEIKEEEKRKLVRLLILSEKNSSIKEKIQQIIDAENTYHQKVIELLSLYKESV